MKYVAIIITAIVIIAGGTYIYYQNNQIQEANEMLEMRNEQINQLDKQIQILQQKNIAETKVKEVLPVDNKQSVNENKQQETTTVATTQPPKKEITIGSEDKEHIFQSINENEYIKIKIKSAEKYNDRIKIIIDFNNSTKSGTSFSSELMGIEAYQNGQEIKVATIKGDKSFEEKVQSGYSKELTFYIKPNDWENNIRIEFSYFFEAVTSEEILKIIKE